MHPAARRAAFASAVLAGIAGAGWLIAVPQEPAPLRPEPLRAAVPAAAPAPPVRVLPADDGITIQHGDGAKLFAAAASRAREPPPPVSGIAQARTFQEAFAAMQKAERERAAAEPPGLAANPFARP